MLKLWLQSLWTNKRYSDTFSDSFLIRLINCNKLCFYRLCVLLSSLCSLLGFDLQPWKTPIIKPLQDLGFYGYFKKLPGVFKNRSIHPIYSVINIYQSNIGGVFKVASPSKQLHVRWQNPCKTITWLKCQSSHFHICKPALTLKGWGFVNGRLSCLHMWYFYGSYAQTDRFPILNESERQRLQEQIKRLFLRFYFLNQNIVICSQVSSAFFTQVFSNQS